MLKRRSVSPVPSKVKGMTVFNTEDVDTKKQPMFFGAPLCLLYTSPSPRD